MTKDFKLAKKKFWLCTIPEGLTVSGTRYYLLIDARNKKPKITRDAYGHVDTDAREYDVDYELCDDDADRLFPDLRKLANSTVTCVEVSFRKVQAPRAKKKARKK